MQFEKYFVPIMNRAYYNNRRWDEGLWRVLELAALDTVFVSEVEQPILDVGCGNGELFEIVFGKNVKAYGIDMSSQSIAEANANDRYVEAVVQDASRMPFKDESFKTVFANSVVEHIDNIELALAEIARVLVQGGKFVYTTPTPLLRDAEYYYWRKLFSHFCLDLIGKRIAKREDTIYHHVNILPFSEWEKMLRMVGFKFIKKYDYVPKSSALEISKFSGASRFKALIPLTGFLTRDQLIQNTYRNWPVDAWIEWYYTALQPYLRCCEFNEEGCGQLIIAEK